MGMRTTGGRVAGVLVGGAVLVCLAGLEPSLGAQNAEVPAHRLEAVMALPVAAGLVEVDRQAATAASLAQVAKMKVKAAAERAEASGDGDPAARVAAEADEAAAMNLETEASKAATDALNRLAAVAAQRAGTSFGRAVGARSAPAEQQAASRESIVPTSASVSLGPTSGEAAVLAGLTRFLLTRAEKETTSYLADSVLARLCHARALRANQEATEDVPIAAFFPATCALESQVVKDAPQSGDALRQLGNSLQVAFEKDLDQLAGRFLSYADQWGVKKASDKTKLALFVLAVVQGLESGEPPLTTSGTAALAATDLNSCRSDQTKTSGWCALRFLGYVLVTLGERGTALDDLDLEDVDEVATFVDGLLSDMLVKVPEDDALLAITPQVDELRKSVRALVFAANDLRQNMRNLRESGRLGLTPASRRDVVVSVLDSIATIWRQGLTLSGKGIPGTAADQIETLADLVGNVIDAYQAVRQRDYDAALAAIYLTASGIGLENFPPEALRSTLPLVASLAGAKTAEDAEAALEKYAAPLGTWRAKQANHERLVSLTGFVGLTGGKQFGDEGGGRFAAFAPVGIDVSMASRWGLFVSLVDLGHLAEVRFNQKSADGSSTTEIGDARFKDIVAPGLYVRRFFNGSPFVWGAGGAYRKITLASGGSEVSASAWQASVFVAVDVTLLPFFHRDTIESDQKAKTKKAEAAQ